MSPRFKTQTILHDDELGRSGNCTQAAIATLLDLPLESVPDFNNETEGPREFWELVEAFFNGIGYEFYIGSGLHVYDGLYLASGPSPRGVQHMVVYKNGELFWDPHPSGTGIVVVSHTYRLTPLDPALFKYCSNS